MSETLLVAIIAAGVAVIGGAVTGAFTYFASEHQCKTEEYKHKLLQN